LPCSTGETFPHAHEGSWFNLIQRNNITSFKVEQCTPWWWQESKSQTWPDTRARPPQVTPLAAGDREHGPHQWKPSVAEALSGPTG